MTFEEIQTRLEPYADDLKPVPSAGWRDKDRVTRLKHLWEDGHSASEIARMLGGGITRNAVIGKIHRLGLSGRLTKSAFRERTSRGVKRAYAEKPGYREHQSAKAQAREAEKRRAKRLLAPRLPSEPLPQTEELFIPPEQRKGVLDLKDHDCRWPIGDPGTPEFHFCGHPKHAAFVYCEFHARKAYAPQQQRPPEAIHWNFPSPVKVARRAA